LKKIAYLIDVKGRIGTMVKTLVWLNSSDPKGDKEISGKRGRQ